MSKIQSIHIDFYLDPEARKQEFWYEQVHRFFKEQGWKLDLRKPVMFIEPGQDREATNLYESEVLMENEADLLNRMRKREELGEPLVLGAYTDGELSFINHLEKGNFQELKFWSLLEGKLVGQEVCIVFEQFTRKLVKPFCDNFEVASIELHHG